MPVSSVPAFAAPAALSPAHVPKPVPQEGVRRAAFDITSSLLLKRAQDAIHDGVNALRHLSFSETTTVVGVRAHKFQPFEALVAIHNENAQPADTDEYFVAVLNRNQELVSIHPVKLI